MTENFPSGDAAGILPSGRAQPRRPASRGNRIHCGFFAVGAIVWSYLLPLMASANPDDTGRMNIDPRLPMACC